MLTLSLPTFCIQVDRFAGWPFLLCMVCFFRKNGSFPTPSRPFNPEITNPHSKFILPSVSFSPGYRMIQRRLFSLPPETFDLVDLILFLRGFPPLRLTSTLKRVRRGDSLFFPSFIPTDSCHFEFFCPLSPVFFPQYDAGVIERHLSPLSTFFESRAGVQYTNERMYPYEDFFPFPLPPRILHLP